MVQRFQGAGHEVSRDPFAPLGVDRAEQLDHLEGHSNHHLVGLVLGVGGVKRVHHFDDEDVSRFSREHHEALRVVDLAAQSFVGIVNDLDPLDQPGAEDAQQNERPKGEMRVLEIFLQESEYQNRDFLLFVGESPVFGACDANVVRDRADAVS